jgi:DNA-directed RNA polymerase subunit RPC12/RpoP
MIDAILCPDCGGVVGATETTEAGPPCRCFKDPNVDAGPDKSNETVSDTSPTDAAPVVQKICRVCGKDVAGQKRVHDQYGYYCYDCAKEVETKERQGRVRCRVCGHLVKPESLTDYEGTKMCPTCHRERIDAQKRTIQRMGFKGARTREEVRQLKILLIIAGVLALFMIYGAYHMMHHR